MVNWFPLHGAGSCQSAPINQDSALECRAEAQARDHDPCSLPMRILFSWDMSRVDINLAALPVVVGPVALSDHTSATFLMKSQRRPWSGCLSQLLPHLAEAAEINVKKIQERRDSRKRTLRTSRNLVVQYHYRQKMMFKSKKAIKRDAQQKNHGPGVKTLSLEVMNHLVWSFTTQIMTHCRSH